MAIDLVVPDLGESVTEGTVALWMKNPGEAVQADEPLLELETDKATLEIPAPAGGVLSEILVNAGEDVEVGAVLARIEPGATAATVAPAPTAAPADKAPDEAAPGDGKPASGQAGGDPAQIVRSGPGGKITLADLQTFLGLEPSDILERSGPAVRKMLGDHGLDPSGIAGTGRDGRLTRQDVLQHLEAPAALATPPASAPAAAAAAGGEERVKMSRMRRTIATRLKEAQNTAAMLTTFNEADMSAVIELRKQYRDTFQEQRGVKLGFMSFFVKAAVGALQHVPTVNAEIDDDHIIYKRYYHIGMAVSTPTGLDVPVIHDCDRKSFAEIEQELIDLATRGRDGDLSMEEMSGGTFSITNGGIFGSLNSTPILNRPQSAILGLHKIMERPIVVDGEIVARPMMNLAVSYDHRLIDGREAVAFLVRIKELIEDPRRLLLEI